MNMIASVVLAALAVVSAPAEVRVDCDRGDSLSAALTKATRRPGTTIQVRGTCTGSFRVAAEGLVLRGDPASPAVIRGSDDAIPDRQSVLDVVAERFTIRNVTVRQGWIGVLVRSGAQTDIQLLDSNFEDNYGGVLIDAGSYASIVNSTFQSNVVGIAVQFGSRGSIVDCDIRDSAVHGVDVFDNSTAGIFRGSVSGSGVAGAVATIGSWLGVGETVMSANGGAHVAVQEQSRLDLGSGATLGSDGDATQLSVFLGHGAILHGSSGIEIWGDIDATGGVYLSLPGIALHGSLWLDAFTDAVLSGTTVDGVVECRRGGDAFCDTGVTANVSGCASAGPPCTSVIRQVGETMRDEHGSENRGAKFGAEGLRELRKGIALERSE